MVSRTHKSVLIPINMFYCYPPYRCPVYLLSVQRQGNIALYVTILPHKYVLLWQLRYLRTPRFLLQHFDADAACAFSTHAKRLGCATREIQNAVSCKRAAVVDPHHYLAAVS